MKKAIVAIFLCGILLTGCRTDTLQNNISQIRIAKAAELEQSKTRSQRAKEIKQSIMQLEDVEQAAVIIEGKTALIGLKLKQDTKKDIIQLKAQADILAKQADASIDGTAITANDNITAMIEKMEKEREP